MDVVERTTFMYDHGSSSLRADLRQVMADHLPAGWLGPFTKDGSDLEISMKFSRALAERGLLVPEWDIAYGGANADLSFGVVVREEMWANCEPRGPQYYGPNWVGPSILHHGTEAQRRQHLPAIAEGRAVWCQGFSEPEAGTDLASLRTRAVPDGDGFRIDGQKIWTSWAAWAGWCYLLARVVDDEGPSGITVFLVPMDRAGITVRMIDGIPGPHHLNEVFLDGVRAERSEILGEIGAGWQVVRDALSNERIGIARHARSDRILALIAPYVDEAAVRAPGLRHRWMKARVRNRTARLAIRNALHVQRGGGSNDFVVSAARLLTTRGDQEVAEVAAEALGDRFFDDRYADDAPQGGLFEFAWRYSRGATIASGTTEALQILLARRLAQGDRLPVFAETADLARAVERAIAPHEVMGAARSAQAGPGSRSALAAELSALLDGLDPRADGEAAVLAAEACRTAGRHLAPVPIESMLLSRDGRTPLALASANDRIEHGDLFPAWDVITRGTTTRRAAGAAGLGTMLGTFVSRVSPDGEIQPAATELETSLWLTLTSWYILGALERGLDLAATHARQRTQFGKPIGDNQGVSFPLADLAADLHGLHQLADHTVWRIHASPDGALADALALRWAALDIAERALRTGVQVHGAIGLCEEHDMSIVVTRLQPRLRLPMGLEETLTALIAEADRHGFDSIHTPAGRG